MNYIKTIVVIGIIAATAASLAHAKVGLGLQASTLGAGVDVVAPLISEGKQRLNVRLNGNAFTYDRTDTYSDIRAKAGLRLESLGLIADWYPSGGAFHLSAGAYWNGNHINLNGRPTDGMYTLNGEYYTDAQVGRLHGTADLGSSFAPYVGIGWGNPLGEEKRWTFFFNVGALFTGSPKLALHSSGGTLSSDPAFLRDLEEERKDAEDDVSFLSVYPVVSIGFAWSF